MNWKSVLILSSLVATAFAEGEVATRQSQEKKPVKESYDYDLFRKDKKILFINAEFLYWSVTEGALDYAIKMKQPAWGQTSDASGSYKIADFGWNPGFRLSFGYFNAPHYWDAYLQYTYFVGTGHDHAEKPNQDDLFLNGTWPQPNPSFNEPVSLASAKTDIKLSTNMVEFLVTRRFHPNPHMRMRVYGGVDVAWLRQNWEIDYKDIQDEISHLHNHWQYTGAGIRLGFIIDWFLGKGGFYFTGQTSAACFAGGYHNVSKQTSSYSQNDYNPAIPLRNAHYHDTRLVPQFQALAGPSWQQAFKNCRTEIVLAYELNIWSNLHEVFHSNNTLPQGPKQTQIDNGMVGIQGLTLIWNLDF